MKRTPIISKDGSVTFRIDELNEHYHSVNGALAESEYVFIENGLKEHPGKEIKIFEVGFGTGLNALLSLFFAKREKIKICYTAIELYPLTTSDWKLLNYAEFFPHENENLITIMHTAKWEERVKITDEFSLQKVNEDLTTYAFGKIKYDLFYFDAFSPNVQPDMWTADIFLRIYKSMNIGGILVTYSAKGEVKRVMESTGFVVEKLKGSFGKRHMLRAKKKF